MLTKTVSQAVSSHILKSVSSSSVCNVCFPLILTQPDQADNVWDPQIVLTTVLRKQAEHTLKVKLQDSHTLEKERLKKGGLMEDDDEIRNPNHKRSEIKRRTSP